jgi:hypothetical protein
VTHSHDTAQYPKVHQKFGEMLRGGAGDRVTSLVQFTHTNDSAEHADSTLTESGSLVIRIEVAIVAHSGEQKLPSQL